MDFPQQSSITRHQSYRFRISLSRKADGVYLHSVSVLSFTGGPTGSSILHFYRYVVIRLYLRRTLFRSAPIPRYERVQSDYENSGDARVRISLSVGRALADFCSSAGYLPRICLRVANKSITSLITTLIITGKSVGSSKLWKNTNTSIQMRKSSLVKSSSMLQPYPKLSSSIPISGRISHRRI